MSKCLITGKKTNQLTKGYPLSREGRETLKQLVEAYNEGLKQNFIEGLRNKEEETGKPVLPKELINRFTPSINNKQALKSLTYEKESDLRDTLKKIIGEDKNE